MPGQPTPFPSDDELQARAVVLLKQRDLFQNVSRRLLADLVEREGLKFVGPPGSPKVLLNVEPAILVVLHGGVTVKRTSSFNLQPATYLRHDPVIQEAGVSGLSIESVPSEGVHVLLMEMSALSYDHMPRMLVNALDPSVLARMT
jgi:hypothetical protein